MCKSQTSCVIRFWHIILIEENIFVPAIYSLTTFFFLYKIKISWVLKLLIKDLDLCFMASSFYIFINIIMELEFQGMSTRFSSLFFPSVKNSVYYGQLTINPILFKQNLVIMLTFISSVETLKLI